MERAGGEYCLDFLTGCQYLPFLKINFDNFSKKFEKSSLFDNLFSRVENRRRIDAPPYPLPFAGGRG